MSDELTWRRRKPGEENWRADSAATDGTYVVYVLNAYGAHQIEAVLVPDSQGFAQESDRIYTSLVGMGSVDEAKAEAQAHHNAACRAKRWRDYMATHEPPENSL